MSSMSHAPVLYRVVRALFKPVLERWVDLQVVGLEHVPRSDPAILASNHMSFMDSLVLPLPVPRPVYFLGKADYWDSWRTRWFFQGVGVVPVQREGGAAGMESLETGVEILRSGDLVGVYPEGTRSPDGRLYRGKTGPVRMALAAGVDIIPCGVIGSDRAQPTGQNTISREQVTVQYGRPVNLSRYADHVDDPFALRAATDEVMYEIMRLSGQEYVDTYAGQVKSADKAVGDFTATAAPGAIDRDRPGSDVPVLEAADDDDGPARRRDAS